MKNNPPILKCGTCSQRVTIYSSDEGTNSYEPWCEDEIKRLTSEIAINKRDLEILMKEKIKLSQDRLDLMGALKKIAASSPCKEGHESFNTPGQMCDQRIAEEALQRLKETK